MQFIIMGMHHLECMLKKKVTNSRASLEYYMLCMVYTKDVRTKTCSDILTRVSGQCHFAYFVVALSLQVHMTF